MMCTGRLCARAASDEGRVVALRVRQKDSEVQPESIGIDRTMRLQDRLAGPADFIGVPKVEHIDRGHA